MSVLVVDRNVVRRRGLVDAAANPSNEFIITDTFLVEMVKHPELWLSTSVRDLTELRRIGDRIRVAASIGECLRKEYELSRPVTRDELLPSELQAVFSGIMQLTRGRTESSRVIADIAGILPGLRAEQPQPSTPKQHIKDRTRLISESLRRETLSHLRNGKLHGDAILYLVESIADRAYESDCATWGRIVLPHPQSIIRRSFILSVYRSICWLQRGGIETASEEKLHNDDYDDEYILLGSFFDGVLSFEKRVNEADAALRRIVNSAWSGELAAAFREYKAGQSSSRQV